MVLFEKLLDDVVQNNVAELLFGVLLGLYLIEDVLGLGFQLVEGCLFEF